MTAYVRGVLLGAAFVVAVGCGGGDEKKAPAGGGDAKGGAPAAAGGGKAYDAAKSKASVKFTIKWTGAKPAPVDIMISGDEYCKSAHSTPVENEQFVVAADGGMPNTFVFASSKDGPLKGMTGFPAPAAVTLDQHGCMYVPHVFGLRTGQTFTIKNSDGTKHNVHSHPKLNKDFNVAQDKGGSNDFSFTTQERAIPFQCDVHSWMKSYAFVVDHPFFGTTDATGTVTIGNLPAGDYTFKVWHEPFTGDKAIESDVAVSVKDGEAVTKVVELK
jgi:hypothetical protein